MSHAPHYPLANTKARFRRPKVLELPEPGRAVLHIRMKWNEPVHVDELLEVEIPVADESFCRCTARVARVDPIVWEEPTRYEVYLDLFNLDEEEWSAVEELLEPENAGETEVPTPSSSRYVLAGPFHEGAPFQRPRREESMKEVLKV